MISRRRALAAGSLAIVGAAGCLADEPDTSEGGENDTDGADSPDSDGTDGSTESDESDLSAVDPEAPLVTTRESETEANTVDESGDRNSDTNGTDEDDADELVLATYGDVEAISEMRESSQLPGYEVTIEFTDSAAESFVSDLESIGGLENPDDQDLYLHLEGDIVDRYTLGPSLADTMRTGEWDGEFVFPAADESTLEDVRDQFESA